MAKTKIKVMQGELIGGEYKSLAQSGPLSLHVDAYIRQGWRVSETNERGEVVIERNGSIYHLGEEDGTNLQSAGEAP